MSRMRWTTPFSVLRRKSVWIPTAVTGFILLVLAGVFAFQAANAAKSLHRAAGDAQALKDNIAQGDVTRSRVALKALQSSTADARERTQGPLWTTAARIPLVGKNVSAVQTVSRVLDELAVNGLPPIVDVAATVGIDAFSPKDGRIDLKPMARLSPAVSAANLVLADGDRELAAVNATGLAGPLRQPVSDLQDKVHDARQASLDAGTALKVMPTMMGTDGARSYLVVFQNNAEVRSSGGLPGAWAIVKVRNGKIKLGVQGSAGDLPQLDKPIKKLSAEETAIYESKMGEYFGDVNFTPDWPRAADLAQAMLKRQKGISVDGVLSVDPVALSYLLRGTGPVTLTDGTKLTEGNTVDQLLNQVYVDHPDPKKQDLYFASAAKEIFEAMSSGAGDPTTVVKQLAHAGREGRVLIWSKDKAEQRILQGTKVSGALPGDTGKVPQVGLYLNDATGAKMQYYLETSNKVTSQECTSDGVQTLVATTTVKSTAPDDAKLLPVSIIGPGLGAPPGSMLMNLRAYAPFNGRVTGATIDGKKTDLFADTHDGRPLATVTALLEPGDKQVVAVTMKSGKAQTSAPTLTATPGVRTRNAISESSCDN